MGLELGSVDVYGIEIVLFREGICDVSVENVLDIWTANVFDKRFKIDSVSRGILGIMEQGFSE